MPNWKKVIISGSNISQLNNDANYVASTGGGIVSSSAQIDHDQTTNFNANEHFTQASITTVGTIGTGVWQGTAISTDYVENLSGTNTGDEPDASTTTKGIVELATTAETQTGTDTTRAVTPNGLENGFNGSTNITTLGTIGTGTWQGSAISTTYIQNLSGTNTGDEVAATTGTAGIVELATNAEADAGTDTTRAVTPSGLSLALGNFQGSSNIATVGNVSSGTWVSTDIGLAYGGTGASLADPNDDRILFWDDSAGSVTWLDIGTGLSITNQTISATATGGSGYEWFDGTTYTTASVDVRITSSLDIYKSGSGTDLNVFTVDGGQGRLFEITDQLSGSLFSVNNISGVPVFEVFSDDVIQLGTHNDEAITINGNQCTATGSFSGSFEAVDGSASTPSITFDADTDTGFYRGTTNTISITIGGSQRGTINEAGWRVNNGSLGVNVAASSTNGVIRASNDIVAYYSSDERLKENVKPIENALDKVSKINGVTFDWIEDMEEFHPNKGNDVGVIAQEIEKVLPEVVETRDSGYKAVKYEKIVPLLIESIKDLKAEIEELKGRL